MLYSKGWLAIVEGINNDAPVGTKLSFVSGATGFVLLPPELLPSWQAAGPGVLTWCGVMHRVLLWRRSSQICFVLIVGGQDDVTVGEGVECKIAGVLQVGDGAAQWMGGWLGGLVGRLAGVHMYDNTGPWCPGKGGVVMHSRTSARRISQRPLVGTWVLHCARAAGRGGGAQGSTPAQSTPRLSH